jgi:hypothetical protein
LWLHRSTHPFCASSRPFRLELRTTETWPQKTQKTQKQTTTDRPPVASGFFALFATFCGHSVCGLSPKPLGQRLSLWLPRSTHPFCASSRPFRFELRTTEIWPQKTQKTQKQTATDRHPVARSRWASGSPWGSPTSGSFCAFCDLLWSFLLWPLPEAAGPAALLVAAPPLPPFCAFCDLLRPFLLRSSARSAPSRRNPRGKPAGRPYRARHSPLRRNNKKPRPGLHAGTGRWFSRTGLRPPRGLSWSWPQRSRSSAGDARISGCRRLSCIPRCRCRSGRALRRACAATSRSTPLPTRRGA